MGRRSVTYGELSQLAFRIASAIDRPAGGLVAIFATRSLSAYSGVLGALAAGHGYVPLNPKFPAPRTAQMLNASEAECMVAGREVIPQIDSLLASAAKPLLVIGPEIQSFEALREQHPRHRFVSSEALLGCSDCDRGHAPHPEDIAYLLFTSGSTGTPKGVPIRHRNVVPYVRRILQHYRICGADRCSQMFDLTFDLSVHDMFCTWSAGAALYCVPDEAVMAPAKFIRENALTCWFSVPSVALFLSRLRLLRPGVFPSLRVSLFCGEALFVEQASGWAAAAPDSVVDNLYGPTETTIAITGYRWVPGLSESVARNGIVPIGTAFEGQDAIVVGENGAEREVDVPGELWLGGSQVSDGYWKDPERSARQFVRLGSDPRIWYRTGDRACRDADGQIHYLGRLDHQVQIRGHRVELGEIEHAVRGICGAHLAVALPWPSRAGAAEGVSCFVIGRGDDADAARIIAGCRDRLPEYMVPRRIVFTEDVPLNANGKVDRSALAQRLND